jgi:hypothetical protein
MSQDPRCCGSGTCIIDDEGRCWCGQQWNGERMCAPDPAAAAAPTAGPNAAQSPRGDDPDQADHSPAPDGSAPG